MKSPNFSATQHSTPTCCATQCHTNHLDQKIMLVYTPHIGSALNFHQYVMAKEAAQSTLSNRLNKTCFLN